ncbi:hypothetical protein D7Y23_33265 [Corallococcus sp. AB050B]|nr:hypothetical protein D7Y23_33265 [Corallococcus sp. AB050B]
MFRATPGALARETLQNSLDAFTAYPVKVTFELLEVPADDLPGRESMKETIAACRKYMLAPTKGDPDKQEQAGKKFFDNATKLLDQPSVPVLRIRDENTTGLEGGPHDEDSAWYRLIRKKGTTSMHGNKGGTFGVGQRAPFAFSGLRTILYSTRTADRATFIGKSILSTHADAKTKKRQNVGYFGIDRGEDGVFPIEGPVHIPAFARRDAVGTDLYITGFEREGWEREVLWSSLRNFVAAIHEGMLEVSIVRKAGGLLVIRKENLREALTDELKMALAEAKSQTAKDKVDAELGSTLQYLNALEVPANGKPFTRDIEGLGEAKLFVWVNPDASSRVMFARKPRILVNDRTHRTILKGHASVFLCENEHGNKVLAKMEDATHRKWAPDLGYPGSDAILRRVNLFVRDSLESLADDEVPPEHDIEDLGRYLPEEDAPTRSGATGASMPTNASTSDETTRRGQPDGTITVVSPPARPARPKNPVQPAPSSAGAGQGGAAQVPGGPEEGPTIPPNPGNGDGTKDKEGRQEKDGPGRPEGPRRGGERGGDSHDGPRLHESDVRFRSYYNAADAGTRLILVSSEAGTVDLRIFGIGESGRYPLVLEAAHDVGTSGGLAVSGPSVLGVTLEAGKRRELLLKVHGEQKLAISVEVLPHG